jgi:hypothetical protein
LHDSRGCELTAHEHHALQERTPFKHHGALTSTPQV